MRYKIVTVSLKKKEEEEEEEEEEEGRSSVIKTRLKSTSDHLMLISFGNRAP